jgi:putative methyltransferase
VYTKIRQFDQTRLINEYEWFGTKQIDLLYNCDANYGIYKRDIDLTAAMVDAKRRHSGYPNKFRAAYAKKSDDKVFDIASMLNSAGMSKGVTLSLQSLDDNTLELIKRKNIAMADFQQLAARYRSAGIPTYTELIVGLPGETLATYTAGIERVLQGGQHDNLNIYPCMLLRNSEMNTDEQIELHGIEVARIPLIDNHSSTRPDEISEYHDVVIATNSMPHDNWRHAYMISWMVQALHCLGLTQYLAMDYWRVNGSYVEFYERLLRLHRGKTTLLGIQIHRVETLLDIMLQGSDDLGQNDTRFGDINWPVEELTFLQLKIDAARFYSELVPFLQEWMTDSHIADAIDFQQQWILGPDHSSNCQAAYAHDIPSMIQAALQGKTGPVQWKNTTLRFVADNYYGNIADWAREIVWYGRKQVLHKRRMHDVVD